MKAWLAAAMAAALMTAGCAERQDSAAHAGIAADPDNWTGFGRTPGAQHFSPLAQINDANVAKLGLAWSYDLDAAHSVSAPVQADGVLYLGTGYSIVTALDAVTGKELWRYDPEVPQAAGLKLRQAWGIRGLAYDKGRVFIGTQDGRLLSLDAKTGKPVWSVMTTQKDDLRFISGPPRVANGRVIIGHGGGDKGTTRGYATAYDAASGKQLWRFYTVPGNPADGFENEAMEMAAKTWAGEWWTKGGGGTVWNAITYDPQTDTVFLGTGNGAPWSHQERSEGKGDNLFLCSIVAVDGKTGAYKWHYQVNPGENWDYNAAMDMQLADLTIDGQPRKVLMQAPKNGFFYVIDRTNGKLISAEPFAKVTWATKIDLATGRPVEVEGARYQGRGPFEMWPGPTGAHNWLPMAFSPKTGLVYLPTSDKPIIFDDKAPVYEPDLPGTDVSFLQAWDPVKQKAVWKVDTPGMWGGGAIATAGNLVFQGQIDHRFNAYAADSGKRLWSFDARSPVLAPPITYRVKGVQYVTVQTGYGVSAGVYGKAGAPFGLDYRTMPRRVLTFAVGGKAALPPAPSPTPMVAPSDPDFRPDQARAMKGMMGFAVNCTLCHGMNAVAGGSAPDLRVSGVVQSREAFEAIVRGGALLPRGMPQFSELTADQAEDIRFYLRARAQELPKTVVAAN